MLSVPEYREARSSSGRKSIARKRAPAIRFVRLAWML